MPERLTERIALPQFSNRGGMGASWSQAGHHVEHHTMWQSFGSSFDGKIEALAVPGLLQRPPLQRAARCHKNTVHPWHLKSRMCQAVSLHPCSARVCVFLSRRAFGCKEEGPRKPHWTRGAIRLYSFCQHLRSDRLHGTRSPTLREKWREMLERVRWGGACMAANLLHMEGMAFPCKMHFSPCVSPVLMMMNLSTRSLSHNPRLCLLLTVAPGQRISEQTTGERTHTYPLSCFFLYYFFYMICNLVSSGLCLKPQHCSGTDRNVSVAPNNENCQVSIAGVEHQIRVLDLHQNVFSHFSLSDFSN